MYPHDNIFNIYYNIGKRTPFLVKRCELGLARSSSEERRIDPNRDRTFLVETVKPRGKYGKAYGKCFMNGKPDDTYRKECYPNIKDEEIPCAGCGEWVLIDVPGVSLDEIFPIHKADEILMFGKYKGKSLGDIYKMDYQVMLDYHKANKADVTIACMPVPIEEASRFGVMITDGAGRITEFEEKPEHPRSNLASMGIYIFSWKTLKESLMALKDQPNCDFGKHILPYCRDNGKRLFAYEFNGYWKDVGTLGSYWEANMELIDIIPEFNLYEEFWKIYTKGDIIRPQYISGESVIERSIIGEGAEIYGEVHNSVIGADVTIEKGAVVRDSIIMKHSRIGAGSQIDKSIIAESVEVGENVVTGVGEEAPNVLKPAVYGFGLVTIAENSVIPSGVKIGKNTAISGETTAEDYPDGELVSGGAIVKKDGE